MQFSHDPFLVTTTPSVGHSLCGEVDYAVRFDGSAIDASSVPLSYDTMTRTLKLYTEDESYTGFHDIEVTGYFRSYPSVTSAAPNLKMAVEIVDPCLSPFSITSTI